MHNWCKMLLKRKELHKGQTNTHAHSNIYVAHSCPFTIPRTTFFYSRLIFMVEIKLNTFPLMVIILLFQRQIISFTKIADMTFTELR